MGAAPIFTQRFLVQEFNIVVTFCELIHALLELLNVFVVLILLMSPTDEVVGFLLVLLGEGDRGEDGECEREFHS